MDAQNGTGAAGRLRLADLLGALSIVSDMGFGLPPQQAMHSCLIATALARRIGLDGSDVRDSFYAGLLMHIGCLSLSHETAEMFGNELTFTRAAARTNLGDPNDMEATFVPELTRGLSARRSQKLAEAVFTHGLKFGRMYDTGSCEVARETARRLGLPHSTQRALHEASESWQGDGAPQGLEGEQIAIGARVARLACDAAFFDDVGGAAAAIEAIRQRSGSVLDPDLCEVFIAQAASILEEANTGDPRERILAVEPEPIEDRPLSHLPELAAAFGDSSDLKSPYFQGHSRRVAELVVAAASAEGFEPAAIERLRVAAFLQDIGRVGISDVVWEKKGPLTGAEWEQVRMHPYHSERILATSPLLEPMARIAGGHHERLDGSGYHRACKAQEISAPARLLAAADALTAMREDRPHRPALEDDQAADELEREARSGRLEADAVAAVLNAAHMGRRARRADLRPGGLSDREIEVLRLVAKGCSNAEVAALLHISTRTAEHHVQHIYTKIGLSSRPAAALFAVEHGLLTP